MNLSSLIRPNILNLKPYSSARHEFTGQAQVMLDANENPYNTDINRYPDPLQHDLKQLLQEIYHLPANQIFAGNGSDEAIDLLFRIFCRPGQDGAVSIDPSYGMYEVSADINDVKLSKVQLNSDFSVNVNALLAACSPETKLMFVCSPNNPTGNLIPLGSLRELATRFHGILVVDEAYIEFAPGGSATELLPQFANIVILRTLSKAYGMAGIRLGIALASAEIIGYMNRVKPPYNVNVLSQTRAIQQLSDQRQALENQRQNIMSEREQLASALKTFGFVHEIFHSDANFLLIRVENADALYAYLKASGVVVRNRSAHPLTRNCLRITIGTPSENKMLLTLLSTHNP